MQRTALRTVTESRALAARRVSRKVLGDLECLHDWYQMESRDYFRRLRMDLECGLLNASLRGFDFILYRKGSDIPEEILEYPVTTGGGSHDRSGRIPYNPRLAGGRFRVVVHPDRSKWEDMKRRGLLQIPWSPCDPVSREGFIGVADGEYSSGPIGVRRVRYGRAAG